MSVPTSLAHPSLSAPHRSSDLLVTRESMGPYEFCWCRSGKKYKWCHYRRAQQDPINVFEVEQITLKALHDGYCSYPDPSSDPCSTTITKAHTIQKKGGLAAIAEDSHVLTVKPTMKDMIESEGRPSPRKIGVNRASVFPGFCSKHDDRLFKGIEGKSLSFDKDSAFMLAYRAITYERFHKEAQFKAVEIQREMDRGHPFYLQVAIQQHSHAFLAGVRIGMQDMDRWKQQYDQRLLSGDREGFHFVAVRFASVLPVVACGAFHLEFDLSGRPLQKLFSDCNEYDHVALTVTVFDTQTVAVLGWVGPEDGPAAAFAESFLRVADERKADALVQLLFVQTDNLFLRPSWWEGLPEEDQKMFKRMILSGTTAKQRSGREYIVGEKTFVLANVVETAKG